MQKRWKPFLSTPSARRATACTTVIMRTNTGFLSTPSARRATLQGSNGKKTQEISIHALREESDSCPVLRRYHRTISIHALREESDGWWMVYDYSKWNFYPRPPRGERHIFRQSLAYLIPISIHALREESDCMRWYQTRTPQHISIHALREESDLDTPPQLGLALVISIHALREESDVGFPLDT